MESEHENRHAGAQWPPPSISAYPHATDFSVITVGTGNPQPSLERASACTVVQYRGRYYVVDMGNGAQNSMLRGEKGTFPFRDIAAFFFTHFHQDHTNDFFDLMTNRWLTGGREVTLIGPPGVRVLYEFLITFFKDDLCYRWLRESERGMTSDGMFTGVEIREITGTERFDVADLGVTTAELTHTMYDLGYRFEGSGRSVVVSGDTSYDERLVTLASGADVLVMDGDERWGGDAVFTMPPATALEARFQPSLPHAGDFGVKPHANLEEIGAMAAASGVKHLILTHLRGGGVEEEPVVNILRACGYKGRVTFAADGMEIAV